MQYLKTICIFILENDSITTTQLNNHYMNKVMQIASGVIVTF